MADEADLEAAKYGEKDLARRDLRDAHLEESDLRDVDLTGAHIERISLIGANLAGAILKESHTSGANMNGANLSGVQASASVFFNVNLTDADLKGINLSRSHLSRSNLLRADLRGADFRAARLNEGTDFTDAIVDETTKFDGAYILRPLSRQDAFRYYDVDRGVLVRRKHGPRPFQAELPQQKQYNVGGEVDKRIKELLDALAPLAPSETVELPIGVGHNNPPELTPLERPEFDELCTTLSTLAVELREEDVRNEIISAGAGKIDRTSSKIAAWVARKADMAADECAKQFGKSLADARIWMAGWLIISGKLAALAELLVGLFLH
ncbi:hypothetical protein GFL88_03905 [Rhizobium leguminosarum bv. viciae]|uniref:pentapeptide repeat-containing protein n=1 Tax=Rhizobium leguminosarum TaxID=384 RepID=UPI001440EA7B|nr:pentapeptide repeat-containing protein [Rhizobium leguminosarum]NKK62688.1 hypothetical protein [Rhizobium leguminosarum bv. viciae]